MKIREATPGRNAASFPGALRRFLYLLGPISGMIGVTIFCGFAINAYDSPIETFCVELPPSATPETVLALARSKDFPAYNVIEARGIISVSGHRNPFFRHTCEVVFKNGQQVGRRVIAYEE